MKHPNITEAIVFGIPINDYEQEICAWVKLKPKSSSKVTEAEIIDYCKKNLSEYQVPRYLKIVDSFPQSMIGKYLRTQMSDLYKKELGI